jgi:hypothetical protein
LISRNSQVVPDKAANAKAAVEMHAVDTAGTR